ncbi:MAG: HAD family hydrolase [Nanoarchaeota archaeon]|nr:HAD family hydrolase [Nanoarchaeota archaeon]
MGVFDRLISLKAAIADYDGTTADTYDRQFQWFKLCADYSGIDFPYHSDEEFRPVYAKAYKEGGIQGSYDFFGLPCDMNDHSHPIHPIYDEFNLSRPAPFFEGMPELIEFLKEEGVKIAFCTNNYTPLVRAGLKRYGLDDDSYVFVDGKSVKKYSSNGKQNYYKKPSKKLMQRALKELGTRPEETIHLCDTLVDLQSAVDIPYGRYNREDLTNLGHLKGFEGDILREGVMTPFGQKHFDGLYSHPDEVKDLVREFMK